MKKLPNVHVEAQSVGQSKERSVGEWGAAFSGGAPFGQPVGRLVQSRVYLLVHIVNPLDTFGHLIAVRP